MGGGLSVKNETDYPLLVSLDQLTPLHWDVVQPNEFKVFGTGRVWFTLACRVSDTDDLSVWKDVVLPVAVYSVGGVVTAGATTAVPGVAVSVADVGAAANLSLTTAMKVIKRRHSYNSQEVEAVLVDHFEHNHYAFSSAGWYADGKVVIIRGGPKVEQNEQGLSYKGAPLNYQVVDERMIGSLESELKKKKAELYLKQAELKKIEDNLVKFEQERLDPNLYRVVLIGETGTGKSTLANRFCGDESEDGDQGPFKTSERSESETCAPQKEVASIAVGEDEKDGGRICVIDTPGLLDTQGRDEAFVSSIAEYLQGIEHVHRFLLVISISNPRILPDSKKALQELTDAFGNEFWNHVSLVFNGESNRSLKKLDTSAADLQKQLRKEVDLQNAHLIPYFGMTWDYSPERIAQILAGLSFDKFFTCEKLVSPIRRKRDEVNKLQREVNGMQRDLGYMN